MSKWRVGDGEARLTSTIQQARILVDYSYSTCIVHGGRHRGSLKQSHLVSRRFRVLRRTTSCSLLTQSYSYRIEFIISKSWRSLSSLVTCCTGRNLLYSSEEVYLYKYRRVIHPTPRTSSDTSWVPSVTIFAHQF
jgi:hypothetical protein